MEEKLYTKEDSNQISYRKIEQDLIHANTNQLVSVLKISIVELVARNLLLNKNYKEKEEFIHNVGREGEEIKGNLEKINKKVDDLKLILEPNHIEENLGLEYFRGLRGDIFNLLMGLSSYMTEISYTHEIARNKIMFEHTKKHHSDQQFTIKTQEFYDDVYKFLTEDMDSLYSKMKEILKVVPIKMSKQRYFDMVFEALIDSFTDYSQKKVELFIKRYKSMFSGVLDLEYGQTFDHYFIQAQGFRYFDFKKATLEELEDVHKKSSQLLMEMHDLATIIRDMGLITNHFIIITMIQEHVRGNNEKIDQEFEAWYKHFNHAIDVSEKDEEERLNYCKTERIKLEGDFKKHTNRFKHFSEEHDKKEQSIKEDIRKRLIVTQNILGYLNDTYLEEEALFLYDEATSMEEDKLEQRVLNFLDFINRNLKSLDNQQRKVRMRRILTLLEQPFRGPENFFNYLKSSIEFNHTPMEQYVLIQAVMDVINEW